MKYASGAVPVLVTRTLTVAGWLAHNWLQHYTYRITLSGWIFVAAGGVALLIAEVTIASQAIRAALANPVVAMRNE